MPLTWDITNVKDIELIKSDAEWGITEVLIFATMHTGMGAITEKNAAEFYARIRLLDKLGPMILASRNGKRYDRPLMPLDIYRRIGLRTNAAYKDESRTSFLKRHILNGELRDLTRLFESAVKDNFESTYGLYAYADPVDDESVDDESTDDEQTA